MVDLAKLTVRLEAENSKLRRDLDKSQKQLSRFGKQSRKITDDIKQQFAGLAAGVSAVAFTGLVRRTVDAGDRVQKLSIRLGASTEALSELRLATELTGVSFETLATGLQRMTRRVSEAANGTGEAVKALDELGISAQQLNNLRPEQQFEVLADALNKVPAQADRVRLAMKLLDTEGVALLQTMDGGAAAIQEYRKQARELGLSLDRDAADAMAAANDELTRLSASFDGFVQSVTVAAIPAVKQLSFVLSDLKRRISLISDDSSLDAVNERINDTFSEINEIESRRSARGGSNGFFDFITGEEDRLKGLKVTLQNLKVQQQALLQRESAPAPALPLPDVTLPAGGSNQPAKEGKKPRAVATRKRAQDELRTAIESTTARLVEQNAVFGLSSELAEIEKLRLMGATEAQLAQVQALTDSILVKQETAEAESRLLEESNRLKEQFEANTEADLAFIESLREQKLLLGLTAQEQAVYRAQAELSADATIQQKETVAGLVTELESMKNKTNETGNDLVSFGQGIAGQIESQFSQFLFDPFNANVEDMARNFISAIGQMAAKALAANLVGALTGGNGAGSPGGTGGGLVSSIVGIIGSVAGSVAHTGGFVGGSNFTRNVPAAAFAGAPHFQTGGFPGLGNNEVPVIAHRGEEILSANDPRNALNGGGGGSNVRIVNSIDPQFATDAMDSAAGEQVVMNIIRRNSTAVRNTLSG